MQGREKHSHQTEAKDDSPSGFVSLKDPPSMHLREDMKRSKVKTRSGDKVMEVALTWDEFQKKHGKS